MNIEKYAQEVKRMRDLQTRYFLTRSTFVLSGAKSQGKRVDAMTNEILNAL